MKIDTCARCHTVLLSVGSDIAYCPNCNNNILPVDREKTEFTSLSFYLISLSMEYADEVGIPVMITDDFQATILMHLGIATEKMPISDESTLMQIVAVLEQRAQKNSHGYGDQLRLSNLITLIKERKILMYKKEKTVANKIQTPISIDQIASRSPIPAFFLLRIAMWFAFAALIATASIAISIISSKFDSSLGLGVLLAVLLAYKGGDLLHIACKHKYFVLALECVEITERSFKDAKNIWDPTSQTAFRKTATISFIYADSTRLHFIFDAGRRFVVGNSYKFYFRCPQNEKEPLTNEMLEQLKIDHEPQPVLVAGLKSADTTPVDSSNEQK